MRANNAIKLITRFCEIKEIMIDKINKNKNVINKVLTISDKVIK